MSCAVASVVFNLYVVFFALQLVVGYENAYDLMERRNQRFYEPNYFQSTMFHDRNRFFTQNRSPHSGFDSVDPFRSKFGNGYDNLGNGIPIGRFHQMPGGWRFQRRPFRERTFDDFNFEPRPILGRSQHAHGSRFSEAYYPKPYNRPTTRWNEFRSADNADFSKVNRFVEDNEDKKQKKSDEFYQKIREGVNTDSLKKETAGEQLHSDQKGENKSSLRSNRVVKKGRTTKGFAVHHHKDETGNSTTFFDETSDFGGQSDLRDIADGFDTRKTLEQITQTGDEKHFNESEEQNGNYGSGFLSGNQKFEKDFSNHEETAKIHTGNQNEDFGSRKTYQYLNGDRFEYADPQVDNYY